MIHNPNLRYIYKTSIPNKYSQKIYLVESYR
jgi:hypothetical protein